MPVVDAAAEERREEPRLGEPRPGAHAPTGERAPQPPRPRKREVNGWLVLDKPVGMTSTHAVAVAKRLFRAKKAGHAGTLDPLASGILPIAFGEATKTVPFVMDGRKAYRFTVRWGEERDTDDSEGAVTSTSAERPTPAAVEAALPAFIGDIMQTPPRYSAIKIAGERAYDLSRAGQVVEIEARPVRVERLALVAHDGETSTLEAVCGKGTYVRSIARDLGRALGCLGHVSALRRARVGPFAEEDAVTLDDLGYVKDKDGEGERRENAEAGAPPDPVALSGRLLPVAVALGEIPAIAVNRSDAGRLRRGQGVLLRGRDAPLLHGKVSVTLDGALLALADADGAEIRPTRIFNLG